MTAATPAGLDPQQLLGKMKVRLDQHLQERGCRDPLFVGIHTGGVWVAQRLHRMYAPESALGELNIAFHRDDFDRGGLHPRVLPSRLPFDIAERYVVLVDDVLYTGRTARAAVNELFDYGRAAGICLAVLLERNGRELPIQADVTGAVVHLEENQHIKLSGPEPLALNITPP